MGKGTGVRHVEVVAIRSYEYLVPFTGYRTVECCVFILRLFIAGVIRLPGLIRYEFLKRHSSDYCRSKFVEINLIVSLLEISQ